MQQQGTATLGKQQISQPFAAMETPPCNNIPVVGQKIKLRVPETLAMLHDSREAHRKQLRGERLSSSERENAMRWQTAGHILGPLLDTLESMSGGRRGKKIARVVVARDPFTIPGVAGKVFFPFKFHVSDQEEFSLCGNWFKDLDGVNPDTPSA